MMAKSNWQYKEEICDLQVYARATRSEIVVRVEQRGDSIKYVELSYPKVFGLAASAHQAALEVNREDMKP
jgi:hypothetical protein